MYKGLKGGKGIPPAAFFKGEFMWIETKDGYVRQDAIIDVHINKTYPAIVWARLINGDSIIMTDFGKSDSGEPICEEAETYLSELMRILIGDRFNNEFVRLLP